MWFSQEMDAERAARPAAKAEEAARTLDLIFKATFRYVRQGPNLKGVAEPYVYAAS